MSVQTLKALVAFHSGTQTSPYYEQGKTLTEAERLDAVPLVFRFIPYLAIAQPGRLPLIKPVIREHLGNLGIDDDELVDCIKIIVDQYVAVLLRSAKKWGMRDVRGTQNYKKLFNRQTGRCPVCGVPLGHDESLDHIVPFNLIGDTSTGENWRITCSPCNEGKTHWLSALQSQHALGWAYSRDVKFLVTNPHLEARYVTLALARQCGVVGCNRKPHQGPLVVKRRNDTGLWVVGNLTVVCDVHDRAGERGELVPLEIRASIG